MKSLRIGALALPAVLFAGLAGPAFAQDESPQVYLYASYHYCDLAKQERADEIYTQLDRPILDAAIADGTIATYGYFAHHTGGPWRRISFTSAPSVRALLDAQRMLGEKADAANKKLGQEYAAICHSHDDYIWRRVLGGAGRAAAGTVAFSTYYRCDATRETQADALVRQAIAPVFDQLVADGKLLNWGWLEHIVGGEYRRLATMSATDVDALMAARGEVVQALTDDAAGDAFTDICDSHTDYIWNVQHGKP